jgi:dihydroxy-acid dehydratase
MAVRRARWVKPQARYGRGYMALYNERVTQAHLGCDFDFLGSKVEIPEPEIH